MQEAKVLQSKLAQLSGEETQQALEFIEFLLYRREGETDRLLVQQIQEGLNDEFLGVKEALAYLEASPDVAD